MGSNSADETFQTAEKLSWVGSWGLDMGGFRPLIGGGFHTDISDDAAASRGKWKGVKAREMGTREESRKA